MTPCCELCGHRHAQKHRIKPGAWGGAYEDGDVVYLCPNHHAAAHLLMEWTHIGPDKNAGRLTEGEWNRLESYLLDRPLGLFFAQRVKPVVIARMVAEGRWYPYKRTLPLKVKGR